MPSSLRTFSAPTSPARRSVARARLARHAAAACAAAGCAGPALPAWSPELPALPPSEDGCAPAVTLLDSPDQPSALGFAALDVLARLGGPRSLPLEWLAPAPSDEYLLSYGPEHGESALHLDLRLREGSVQHRFRVPLPLAPAGTECDPGALYIPVEVGLRSAAQALDERFDAWLVAPAPERGRIVQRLEARQLTGGLTFGSIESFEPERELAPGGLRFAARLWPGGSVGSLELELATSAARRSRGALSDARLPPPPPPVTPPGPLAVWPSQRACAPGASWLSSEAPVLGFSARDVLEALADGGPHELTWPDGSATHVYVEPSPLAAESCQTVGESLSIDAAVRARSDDGALDEVVFVRVEAADAGGSIGALSLTALAGEPTALEAGSALEADAAAAGGGHPGGS